MNHMTTSRAKGTKAQTGKRRKLELNKSTVKDLMAPNTGALRGGKGSGLAKTYNSCNPCSY